MNKENTPDLLEDEETMPILTSNSGTDIAKARYLEYCMKLTNGNS
ncbi:MAG: hypothetical protein PHO80_00855 [Candidatus Gracilibacteria bacterium]|nr:hypothetical protein [Candidatus Gracilibacteria bacterium]MDD4530085.1 hypothetical protein [Candidatus Gracilibacteria bacterium]